MKKSGFKKGYFTNKEGKLVKLYFGKNKKIPEDYIISLLASKEECAVELSMYVITGIIATGFIYNELK